MKMSKNKPDWNQLNSLEKHVIVDKGTESVSYTHLTLPTKA